MIKLPISKEYKLTALWIKPPLSRQYSLAKIWIEPIRTQEYSLANIWSSSFWTNHKFLQRTLIAALILLLATLTLDVFLLNELRTPTYTFQMVSETISNKSNICETENCVNAASSILRSIDLSVEPCQDFYAYACNNWIKNNPIPDDKPLWGVFSKLEEQNRYMLRKLLEQSELFSSAIRKVKAYYFSCMDQNENIEKLGDKPIKELIRNIGGWNITNSGFNMTDWTLQHTLQTVHNRYNMEGLFRWAVTQNKNNFSQPILKIDQASLILPTREHYLNKTIRKKVLPDYFDYMTKIGILLGGDPVGTKHQMLNILNFETRLASITTSVKNPDEPTFVLMTFKELQQRAPFIDWRAHFEDAFKIFQRKFEDDEELIIYNPKYLLKLTSIINKYSAIKNGKTTINNYLVWKTVQSLINRLSRPYRNAYKEFHYALIEETAEEKPWQYCVADTNRVLGDAVGAMFVREVLNKNTKYLVQNMVHKVRHAFISNLLNSNWMDDEERYIAWKRIDSISDMIGLANSNFSTLKELNLKYKGLEINSKHYFQNYIQINIFNLKQKLQQLDKPVDENQLNLKLHSVNAFYTRSANDIDLPASFLQPPFYDPNNPQSLNFGAIGVVMGHELAHAFEFLRREYKRIDRMHQQLDSNNIYQFEYYPKCFEKQYTKYKIHGRHLNGSQTLRENIADNAGLKAAYHAFIDSESISDMDYLPLPGLKLSHRQLFFVSFAQVWCSAETNEILNLEIDKESHSPAKYRVIGSLQNSQEFSKEFQCAPGTPMNPRRKCKIW